MLRDRLIDKQLDHHTDGNELYDQAGQRKLQDPRRPGRSAEDAVVRGEVASGQRLYGPQNARDGVGAAREDGADHQDQNMTKGRVGEGHRKAHENRLRRRWKKKHSRPPCVDGCDNHLYGRAACFC